MLSKRERYIFQCTWCYSLLDSAQCIVCLTLRNKRFMLDEMFQRNTSKKETFRWNTLSSINLLSLKSGLLVSQFWESSCNKSTFRELEHALHTALNQIKEKFWLWTLLVSFGRVTILTETRAVCKSYVIVHNQIERLIILAIVKRENVDSMDVTQSR